MPFFQVNQSLIYYAHVPKCGGSSIANYIRERFGPLAFHDNIYNRQPEAQRWTASSPQHVDAVTLERLIPLSFFAGIFTIVRHPLGRAVSTYHFQLELERSIPQGTSFTDWLKMLETQHAQSPFIYDNHTRPMSDIVPEGATVFHMEHGLDALVPWFDALAGQGDGPRAIVPENVRGEHVKVTGTRVTPSDTDIDLIAQIYAADFKRFGYVPGDKTPTAAAPEITPDFIATRDRALAAAARPAARLRRKVMRKIWRL
jgi:hypothetical protein